MRSTPRRGVAVVALLLVLGGLCVQYGSLTHEPAANRFPGNDDLTAGSVDPDAGVVLAGTVRAVDGDRTVLELDDGPRVEVRGLDEASDAGVDPGDDVWLYGVVRPDGSVAAERAVVRAPWEITYLYGVSALGGLLVLVRFVRTWRFDADRLAFVPREGE